MVAGLILGQVKNFLEVIENLRVKAICAQVIRYSNPDRSMAQSE